MTRKQAEAEVAGYLDLCAELGLANDYHPTPDGAVKLIFTREKDKAARELVTGEFMIAARKRGIRVKAPRGKNGGDSREVAGQQQL
jgi:hypothetical protein